MADPADPPVAHGRLYAAVGAHAARRPDRAAVRCGDRQLSWAQLLGVVNRRAGELAGDAGPVVVTETDRLAFVVDYLAAGRTRRPVVVDDGGPATDEIAGLVRRHAAELRALCPGAPEVLFTSGSTGPAKAVALDAGRMAEKAAQINAAIGEARGHVEVLSVPMRHSFGLGRLRCALLAGRTVHLTGRSASPEAFLDAEPSPGTVTLGLISSTVKLLLARYRDALRANAPRIAQIEVCTEPLEPEYRSDLAALLPGARLVLTYGMTELSRISMVDLRREGGSVGRPMPGTEVRAGGAGPAGAPGAGDLFVRGAAMARAHLGGGLLRPVDPAAWLATGDHGELGADGVLTVHGRRGEQFSVLGKQVVPELTQAAVRRLAGAAECLCVPAELTAGVFILVALVVAGPGGQVDPVALHRDLAAALPAHQVPRRIVAVDVLPRLPNGKLDHRAAVALAGRNGTDR